MSMHLSIYGRLGVDPKPIQTAKGTSMAVATLAVALTDRQGEEHTQWLGGVCFGRVANTLLKGDLLSACGRAQFNAYTYGSGQPREQLQVIADSVVSSRSVRPSGNKRRSTSGAGAHAETAGVPATGDDLDDELAF